MTGCDFDAKLHWPIRYKRTFFLINQINNKDNLVDSIEITKEHFERLPNSFKRPSDYRNKPFGIGSLISNTTILEERNTTNKTLSHFTSL